MNVTKKLMIAGMIAGPLFAGLLLVQAITRPGFNLVIHGPSQLGTGDFGWIQATNFIVGGILFLAFTVGLRQLLKGRAGGVFAPILMALFSLTLIVSGIFPTDPAFGFPPGTPHTNGELSASGKIHMIAPIAGGFILPAAYFVFARFFAKELQDKKWMLVSILVGLAYFIAGVTFMSTKGPTGEYNLTFLWTAGVIGWMGISLIAWKIKQELLK